MSIEARSIQPSIAAHSTSRWKRFLRWLEAVDEAVHATYDDVQDIRIARLERDVAALKAAAGGDAARAAVDQPSQAS